MDDVSLITRYIAAWNWHIIALLFLLKTIDFITSWNYAGIIAFSLLFFGCEFMALKRQREIQSMKGG